MHNSSHLRPNNFDLIRLLAALQVIIFHGKEHLQLSFTGIGQFLVDLLARFPGVPIFFVISGFLISSSYLRNSNLKQYAINRGLRIWPALWFCFFVGLISVTLLGYWATASITLHSFGAWVGAQLTFVQFYNPDFMRGYGVGVLNGSLWTIPVEIQFYILLPVIYLLLRNQSTERRNIIFMLLFAISFVLHLLLRHTVLGAAETLLTKLVEVSFLPHVYMFLLGVIIRHNWNHIHPLLSNKVHYWMLLYVVSSIILDRAIGLSVTHNNINGISFIFLALTIFSFAYSFPGLSSQLLRGYDLSYGTYLYHMIVINVLVHLELVGSQIYLLLVFVITLIMALFSWKIIEKPALDLKSFKFGKRKPSAETVHY